MSFVGNLLWFVLGGGWLSGLIWALAGLICALTIIGIPFSIAAFRISRFAFFPFGRQLVDAELVGEKSTFGAGLGNVLWVILAGFWLALIHAIYGLLCFTSIIGIPFGLAHFKLAQVSFAPLGKRIVSSDLAIAARVNSAREELDRRLGRSNMVEDQRSVEKLAPSGDYAEATQRARITEEISISQDEQGKESELQTTTEQRPNSEPPIHTTAETQVMEQPTETVEPVNAATEVTWVPALIGYGVWFALLLVFRSVLLSMKSVGSLGYALSRFASQLYPVGILWTQLIDAAFLTVIIFSVLALGGRLRRSVSLAFPKLSRLGEIGYLIAVAGSIAIGYSAYASLILPPLRFQGVEWAYRLIFLVIIAGIGATAVYEFIRMVVDVNDGSKN